MAGSRRKRAEVVALSATQGRIEGPRVGVVVGVSGSDVRVDYEGNGLGPLPARVSEAIDDRALALAARDRSECLLVFERGDPSRPIVLALLRSRTPLTDALLSAAVPSGPRIARLDGKRVELEAQEEVVLRCGRASLTLRRDGRVVLRGVTVVTQADAVQKIRGGKVQIN